MPATLMTATAIRPAPPGLPPVPQAMGQPAPGAGREGRLGARQVQAADARTSAPTAAEFRSESAWRRALRDCFRSQCFLRPQTPEQEGIAMCHALTGGVCTTGGGVTLALTGPSTTAALATGATFVTGCSVLEVFLCLRCVLSER